MEYFPQVQYLKLTECMLKLLLNGIVASFVVKKLYETQLR